MVSAIWQRYFPEHRSGKYLSDEEYSWVHGAILCLERSIRIWESLPKAIQEDTEVFDCYRDTKKTLNSIMGYGLFYERAGQMLERESNHPLPPLRCLNLPADFAPPDPMTTTCGGCGSTNRDGFNYCRKCGSSHRN